MNLSVGMDIAAALAVTALLAESYGAVRRRLVGNVLAPVLLGVLFGLMAMFQMFNTFEPFDGLILDMRNVSIALAGAFLGWRGLIPCLAIACATRIGIGGIGMEAGVAGMVIAGLAGIIWARKMAFVDRRSFGMLLLLALGMSTHLLSGVVVPRDLALWFFTVAAGPMLAMNMVAVPLIGSLLERENRRIRAANKMQAAATHEPVSGLLLGPAFMRELTNAYAARPFGTFAGFMTIEPVPGVWRTAIGLFGEPAPIALDRQQLATIVEHADLAGHCADGRILVPLSAEEMGQISRIKSDMNTALRNTPSAAAGTVVTLSVIEAPTPTGFLRITASAVTAAHVDWKNEAKARQSYVVRPGEPSAVRRGIVLSNEEHDVLFAKAEFLIERKDKYAH